MLYIPTERHHVAPPPVPYPLTALASCLHDETPLRSIPAKRAIMENTYFVDVDLVYHRVPRGVDDDLDEIDFCDMEPIDNIEESVGVFPHEAMLIVPVEPYDIIGVGSNQAVAMTPAPGERHFAHYTIGTLGDFGEEDFPTDEYTEHDSDEVAASFAS